jgi:hypothetical protein
MPIDDAECRVCGFRATAEYLESRARRTRREAEQARLMKAAQFYRELGAITPGLPVGFKTTRDLSRTNRYRDRAEECRTIADLLVDPDCKQQLANLAVTYDNLAASCEKIEVAAAIRPSDAVRRDIDRIDGQRGAPPALARRGHRFRSA